MPWKETGPWAERIKFVTAIYDTDDSITDVCERSGISRQKGHKWLARYAQSGSEGLADRSRRPHSNSRAIAPSVAELIVELRRARPRWGPRKLLAVLERDYPRLEFPAPSTVGDILRRHGLVAKRRRRPATQGYGAKLAEFTKPNSVWCADFKGQFFVGGRYCYPLTITDGFSRYLLCCHALKQTLHAPVKKQFEQTFREFASSVPITGHHSRR